MFNTDHVGRYILRCKWQVFDKLSDERVQCSDASEGLTDDKISSLVDASSME